MCYCGLAAGVSLCAAGCDLFLATVCWLLDVALRRVLAVVSRFFPLCVSLWATMGWVAAGLALRCGLLPVVSCFFLSACLFLWATVHYWLLLVVKNCFLASCAFVSQHDPAHVHVGSIFMAQALPAWKTRRSPNWDSPAVYGRWHSFFGCSFLSWPGSLGKSSPVSCC